MSSRLIKFVNIDRRKWIDEDDDDVDGEEEEQKAHSLTHNKRNQTKQNKTKRKEKRSKAKNNKHNDNALYLASTIAAAAATHRKEVTCKRQQVPVPVAMTRILLFTIFDELKFGNGGNGAGCFCCFDMPVEPLNDSVYALFKACREASVCVCVRVSE